MSTNSAWAGAPVELNALTGLRVVEFAANIAGPYAGMILAQLGADVIKVEPPEGDDARAFAGRVGDTSIAFAHVNAGKRGCVLDMKSSVGRAAAQRLLETADVVIQAMRPGTADRLGIGRADVARLAPEAIYYDISAFGAGPVGRGLPGYDPMVQAFTGIMQMTGHDGSPPTRCAPSIVDFGTGQWVALGVLATVLARRAGQPIGGLDTALVDTAFSVVPYQASAAYMYDSRPARAGSGNPIAAPYQCFRARDGYLLVAAANARLWRALVAALDAPHLLDDPRFASVAERSQNQKALEAALNEVFGTATMAEWQARLEAARVPVSAVYHLDEAVDSDIAIERQTFERCGEADLVRLPLRVDGHPVAFRHPAPRLGEHTAEIFAELGFDAAAIGELIRTP